MGRRQHAQRTMPNREQRHRLLGDGSLLQQARSRVRCGRSSECRIELPRTPTTVDLGTLLGVPMGPASATQAAVEVPNPRKQRCRTDRKAAVEVVPRRGRSQLRIRRDVGPAVLHVSVDCIGVRFRANLDFDRLLQLADTANLEEIDDFASIELFENEGGVQSNGTRITAYQLEPFVRRELRAERRKGNVRNVASWSGLDQFVWHLSRCTPVAYVRHRQTGRNSCSSCWGAPSSLCSRA